MPTSETARALHDPLARLTSVAHLVSLAAEEELFAQGAPVRHCYRVETGCVRSVRLMEDGRRLVDRFLLPGDLLGFEADNYHDVSAEAVGGATLSRFPIESVTDLAAKDVQFARFLWSAAAKQVRDTHRHGLLLGRKTAVERVASFLRDLAYRLPSEGEGQMLTLPMARADIADHLGLTVETVSRTLTQLRQDDCISVHHNSIGIHHAEALAELTGDAEMMTRAMHHRNLTRH